MSKTASETLAENISIYLKGLGYNNVSAGYTPEQVKQVAGAQKDAAEVVTGTFDFFV